MVTKLTLRLGHNFHIALSGLIKWYPLSKRRSSRRVDSMLMRRDILTLQFVAILYLLHGLTFSFADHVLQNKCAVHHCLSLAYSMISSFLLFAAGSVSGSTFSWNFDSPPASDNLIVPSAVILPPNVQGKSVVQAHTNKDMQPSVTVISVFNETRGSGFHPFACWEHPNFFSAQRKKWAAGTKQRFELNCWTNPVFQTQASKGSRTAWAFAALAFDNDITWFNAPRERCWFPDFVVQKDAAYGPSFGNFGRGGETATPVASAPAASGTAKATTWGPPWLRAWQGWAQGGTPWTWWANFIGNSNGPAPEDDLKNILRYCPTPVHQVGTFREQYNGQSYCYQCTRLDCANRPISLASVDSKVDLACYTNGNTVESDTYVAILELRCALCCAL
jgi:hypothetical protein